MKPVCLGITWGLFGYYLGLFGLLGIATPLPHPQLTTTTLDLFFFFFYQGLDAMRQAGFGLKPEERKSAYTAFGEQMESEKEGEKK
jgi:hypothetical protein